MEIKDLYHGWILGGGGEGDFHRKVIVGASQKF